MELFTTIAAAGASAASSFATIAPIISGVGTIAGGLMQAKGQRQAAASQKANLDYQAAQLEAQGKEEQAAAQHEVFQKRREKELTLSALQARGAASGFETTDPTGLQIGEDIAKYGTLQEMMAAYGGASRRAGLNAEAIGRRAEGAAAVQGAKSAAMGTILGGLTSGFSRFAEYKPASPTTSYRYS